MIDEGLMYESVNLHSIVDIYLQGYSTTEHIS